MLGLMDFMETSIMNTPVLKQFASIVFACSLLLMGHRASAEERPGYQFSPVNQYGINLTAEYWNPIIDYVSEKSGVRLTLKIGRTSADTTTMLLAKEADFAFTNHLFTPERQQLGWRVFGRRNTPPIYSQIIVPADSPITQLPQLAGVEMGFPGPEATVAYKMSYAQLLSKGIDVNVVFGGNMDAALVQLFSGKVKAVGGNSQLIEGFAKRENKTYRVLWQSDPIHDLPLMVSPRVPPNEAKAVAEAFLGMARTPQGIEVIRRAAKTVELPESAYFIPASASDYAAYLNFFKNAPAQLR
jgi:phosphonate transport system substrate-binding protein